MKELTIEERHETLLNLLKVFDSFCRKNNLKYSMGEGTMIGTMRHHGFIPWDDDIDIIMLRDEYNKFVDLYDKSEKGRYGWFTIKKGGHWWECYSRITDPDTIIYYSGHPYIHGQWITILPIDNYPDDDKEWDRMFKQMKWHVLMCRLKNSKWDPDGNWLHEFAKLIVRKVLPVSLYRQAKARENILSKYKDVKTKRRGFMSRWEHQPWVCSSEAFDGYIEAEFEGLSVMVFKGYDEYLRCQYGDWTKLPPKEKQIGSHFNQVFYLDK